jgi:hypothetical protein
MNEFQYYSGEFTDADLDVLADAGEFYLHESGFFLIPTQKECKSWPKLATLYCSSIGLGRSDAQLRASALS